jgi:hypothetical protein
MSTSPAGFVSDADRYYHTNITRTCQNDTTWSNIDTFTCETTFTSYTYNLLTAQPRSGDPHRGSIPFHSGYSIAVSPYECENNLTLCKECQENVDAHCRDSLPAPFSRTWHADKGDLLAACESIAKNLCPKRCAANGIANATICDNCDLSADGISFCAATRRCTCKNNYYGDGCQSVDPPPPPPPTPIPTPAPTKEECDWCWLWYLLIAICGTCCIWCFLVSCYNENYADYTAPRFGDVCMAGGYAVWYKVCYAFWYYCLGGCFCRRGGAPYDPRRRNDSNHCWYTFWYFIWSTLLCGICCGVPPTDDELHMQAKEAEVEMKDEYFYRPDIPYDKRQRYPRTAPGAGGGMMVEGPGAAPGTQM